jgi:hypothetical protein
VQTEATTGGSGARDAQSIERVLAELKDGLRQLQAATQRVEERIDVLEKGNAASLASEKARDERHQQALESVRTAQQKSVDAHQHLLAVLKDTNDRRGSSLSGPEIDRIAERLVERMGTDKSGRPASIAPQPNDELRKQLSSLLERVEKSETARLQHRAADEARYDELLSLVKRGFEQRGMLRSQDIDLIAETLQDRLSTSDLRSETAEVQNGPLQAALPGLLQNQGAKLSTMEADLKAMQGTLEAMAKGASSREQNGEPTELRAVLDAMKSAIAASVSRSPEFPPDLLEEMRGWMSKVAAPASSDALAATLDLLSKDLSELRKARPVDDMTSTMNASLSRSRAELREDLANLVSNEIRSLRSELREIRRAAEAQVRSLEPIPSRREVVETETGGAAQAPAPSEATAVPPRGAASMEQPPPAPAESAPEETTARAESAATPTEVKEAVEATDVSAPVEARDASENAAPSRVEETPVEAAGETAQKSDASTAPQTPEDKNASRIARVLIGDLKLYHGDELKKGIEAGDLEERLREVLEQVRETYRTRVPEGVKQDYLSEALAKLTAEIRGTVEEGAPRADGEAPAQRDAVVESPKEAPQQPKEASEAPAQAEAESTSSADPDFDKNASRIARVMVADLKLYHSAEVIEGIKSNDFADRLKEVLGHMRETFASRVPEAGKTGRDYLGDAIQQMVARTKLEITGQEQN